MLLCNMNDSEQYGRRICDACVARKKILCCGNGGSAADAQSIASEYVGCYEKQRRSWPAIALTTDTSALTAVSNDLGYGQVFARQRSGLAEAGDIVSVISTSGRWKKGLKSVEPGRELGLRRTALK